MSSLLGVARQQLLLHVPVQHLSPPPQSALPQHSRQTPLQSFLPEGHWQLPPVHTLPPPQA